MENALHVGLTGQKEITVTCDMMASSIGSGHVYVYATAMMIAGMEATAVDLLQPLLPEGCTTVGGSISSSHLAPSAVGAEVRAHASLEKIDGRKLYFNVIALEGDKVLGEGTHLRFIVDRKKFLQKLGAE